jgi:hypothetical protein
MKNLVILLCAIVILSFQNKNIKDTQPSLIWNQFVGEDSIKHIYKFRKIGESLILESIIIQEKNPAGSPKFIFSNQIIFDSIGKFNKLFVNRSTSYKNNNNMSYNQYDEDIIRYKNDSIESLVLKNKDQLVLKLNRNKHLLTQRRSDNLDYPIYNFIKRNEINIPTIGKGVSPRLNVEEYNKQLIRGLKE